MKEKNIDRSRSPQIWITGYPRRGRRNREGIIIMINISELKKDVRFQIKRAQRLPSRIDTEKPMLKHIVSKINSINTKRKF